MGQAMAALPESEFYFHMAAAGLLALGLMVARALLRVYSGRTGRRERAQGLALATVRQLLVLVCLWTAIVYASGAWERAGAHNCRRVPSGDVLARYAAEYCYLSQDRILLRVYSTHSNAILARRTYSGAAPARLRWERDVLVYDPAAPEGRGHVKLPPTLRDRLLARLP